MVVIAAWAGGSGFLSGMMLNAVNRQQGLLETVPWNDPVVLRMGMLVVWLVAAAVTSRLVCHRPEGRRVTAVLSLVSLAMLTGSILWGVLGTTRHGIPPSQSAAVSLLDGGRR